MKPSNQKIQRAFDLLSKTQAQIKRIENPKKTNKEDAQLLKNAQFHLDAATVALSIFNRSLAQQCKSGG